MKSLQVRSSLQTYTVEFSQQLPTVAQNIINKYPTSAHVLIDKTIWGNYKKELDKIKKYSSLYSFEAKEKNKSLNEIYKYIDFLLKNKIQKKDVIIVIGGGLVQDIGSFTSHILLRGVDWVFVPTTLLAMADSCIGSKSGINVGQYKNQVGSFHPPTEICIYSKFLLTLPDSDILTGIGEILKHALIKGGRAYTRLRQNIQYLREKKDIKKMEEVIYESLQIKKEIVEEDEFEKGKRKLLNYGHTFGHAIEGYTKNDIPHGIAVSMGMDLANYISVKRDLLKSCEFDAISQLLHENIPYSHFPITNSTRYIEYISRDKKVVGKQVQAILCRGIGKVEIVPTELDNGLKKDIDEYIQTYEYLHSTALRK